MRGRPPGGGGSPLALLLALSLLLALVGGAGWLVYRQFQAVTRGPERVPGAPGSGTVTVVIAPGESTAAVAEDLYRKGLISSTLSFRLLVKLRGAGKRIEAGTYELARGLSMDELLDQLRHAPTPETVVTIREGLRATEIADLVAQRRLADPKDFLERVKAWAYSADFLADRPPGASLEGYLFPDTYRLATPTAGADSVIQKMLETFGERFTPAMRKQAVAGDHTLFQVVTVASIVEREARVPEERPLIAGVYWNRLKAGVGLFADPTVQYALGLQKDQGSWWKRDLTPLDLKVASPYNTYLNTGLPPGPICSPGLDSLRAALEPKGDYLYFVHKGDGSHAFARSLAEHNANVARYQK